GRAGAARKSAPVILLHRVQILASTGPRRGGAEKTKREMRSISFTAKLQRGRAGAARKRAVSGAPLISTILTLQRGRAGAARKRTPSHSIKLLLELLQRGRAGAARKS